MRHEQLGTAFEAILKLPNDAEQNERALTLSLSGFEPLNETSRKVRLCTVKCVPKTIEGHS